jgi:hypothetical protein
MRLAHIRSLRLPLVAACAFLALTSTGRAMCAYNDMANVESAFIVELDCGTFCKNDWILGAGDSGCRPSVGGTLKVLKCPADYGVCEEIVGARVSVEAHGYTVLYGTGGAGSSRVLCAYHADDTPAGPCVSFAFS